MKNLLVLVLFTLALGGCKLADLRNDYVLENHSEENGTRGRSILNAAWKKQGFKNFKNFEVYEVEGKDHWRGFMGKSGNPWPVNEEMLNIKFAAGTFDSKFEIKSGGKSGFKAGMQSWNYYEEVDGETEFMERNKQHAFVLAAYQYFFELADRLKDVPTVQYAGEVQFVNNDYQLVFVTWDDVEPTEDYDQYMIYINKKSGLIEYVAYTLRESYLPAPKRFYGSILFENHKEIGGVLIPFTQTVFFNGPDEDRDNYLHRLELQSFEFDSFEKSILYPDPNISEIGDIKIKAD